MLLLLRLAVPALLLGAVLLLGERPSCPPDELPAAEMTAAADDPCGRAQIIPVLVPGGAGIVLAVRRLSPAAAERLTVAAEPPEARSLSPPLPA